MSMQVRSVQSGKLRRTRIASLGVDKTPRNMAALFHASMLIASKATRPGKCARTWGRKFKNHSYHETSYVLCTFGIGLQAFVFGQGSEYTMTIESTAAASADNGNVYRFYVNAQDDPTVVCCVRKRPRQLDFRNPRGRLQQRIQFRLERCGDEPSHHCSVS